MRISTHYYGILALCLSKNMKFETARRIAFASFHVDDAKTDTYIFEKKYKDPLFDNSEKLSRLLNVSTCHSYNRLKTFNYHSMMTCTVPFHYFPGCTGNGFDTKMQCVQNPGSLADLLKKTVAEKSFDPEKFGMLLHIYADTFSHQGFSGILSQVNDVLDYTSVSWYNRIFYLARKISAPVFEKFFDYVTPAYGHMQVIFSPDNPSEKWSCRTDRVDHCTAQGEKMEIDNRVRFREAFLEIESFIDKIKDRSVFIDSKSVPADPEVFRILGNRAICSGKRIRLWCRYITKKFGIQKKDLMYDEYEYVKKAFTDFSEKNFYDRVVRGVSLKKEYAQTSWYGFVRAVSWYKEEFFRIMEKQGLKIPL